MTANKFSNWKKWTQRSKIDRPGVYCIAISDSDLSDQAFDWIPEIKYVGMTNSRKGLIGRLQQFDNTINGKSGHGGAARFRYKHAHYQMLVEKLYVAVSGFEFDVILNNSDVLRRMGDVAKFEYDCLANYFEKFKELPEFNDKQKSPKYRS